jgi:hypothetical protein
LFAQWSKQGEALSGFSSADGASDWSNGRRLEKASLYGRDLDVDYGRYGVPPLLLVAVSAVPLIPLKLPFAILC